MKYFNFSLGNLLIRGSLGGFLGLLLAELMGLHY